MVTTQDRNEHREEGCTGNTVDKKYFEVGVSFIKRTLRPHEWLSTDPVCWPSACFPQRWQNEAAVLEYLRKHTNIPIPRLLHVFEDDGVFYFSTERVPGVSMRQLTEDKKLVVTKELLEHIATLKKLGSKVPGVPGLKLLCPPSRIHSHFWKYHTCWKPKQIFESNVEEEYVFCHNDLGQHNILVDPETLKINAIIDWEFGGFWPEWFERPYWERDGPSAPLEGEENDIERCREWLAAHCEEVEMEHPLSLKQKMGTEPRLSRSSDGSQG